MPTALTPIGPRAGASPLQFNIADLQGVEIISAFAHFDGSGAGGDYRAALTIRSQSGAILSRTFPTDSVTAGDSADVTFGPFLRGSAAAAAGGGIQFDTYPQDGDWLYIKTTGTGPTAAGIDISDTSGSGIYMLASGSPSADIVLNAGRMTYVAAAGSAYLVGGSHAEINAGNSVGITCDMPPGDYRLHLYAVNQHIYILEQDGIYLSVTGSGTFATSEKLYLNGNTIVTVPGEPVTGSDGKFVIRDGVWNPILEVRAIGYGGYEYHIKTGATWVADL